MTQTTVWAYAKLPELENQTGFVAVDEALAADLIASGEVQDPRVGVFNFKYIGTPAPAPTPTPTPSSRRRELLKGQADESTS